MAGDGSITTCAPRLSWDCREESDARKLLTTSREAMGNAALPAKIATSRRRTPLFVQACKSKKRPMAIGTNTLAYRIQNNPPDNNPAPISQHDAPFVDTPSASCRSASQRSMSSSVNGSAAAKSVSVRGLIRDSGDNEQVAARIAPSVEQTPPPVARLIQVNHPTSASAQQATAIHWAAPRIVPPVIHATAHTSRGYPTGHWVKNAQSLRHSHG